LLSGLKLSALQNPRSIRPLSKWHLAGFCSFRCRTPVSEYSRVACECAASEPALTSTNLPTRTLYSRPQKDGMSSNTNGLRPAVLGRNYAKLEEMSSLEADIEEAA
jgi:hypothetical protein